jgi:hypothetical protein
MRVIVARLRTIVSLMTLIRRRCLLLAASVPLLANPSPSSAQRPMNERSGFAVTTGLSSLPDGLSTQCGTHGEPGGGGGGPEVGAALMRRVSRFLVLQADARATGDVIEGVGCDQVGAFVDTAYAPNLHHHVLATSALRAGLETPPGTLLLRLTAGLGVVWGSEMPPVGVVAIGTGTRGPGTRFFVEFERSQTRLHATEVRQSAEPTQPDLRTAIVVHPVWHSLRLGIEWPLHRG